MPTRGLFRLPLPIRAVSSGRGYGKRHPREMAEPEVNAFLSHLANERHVSASTQNQALCALVFLYKVVLEKPLGEIEGPIRLKRRRKAMATTCNDDLRASP